LNLKCDILLVFKICVLFNLYRYSAAGAGRG
jgi:hypothetical protein